MEHKGDKPTGKQSWTLPILLFLILGGLIGGGLFYKNQLNLSLQSEPEAPQSPTTEDIQSSPTPDQGVESSDPTSPAAKPVDLSVDSNGLSKATVIIQLQSGTIKFKLYPNDAPQTVNRIIQLIQQGFYNGLTFHRVVSGFVIQGGDPKGDGTGGTGQNIKAEFNSRKHAEGAVAMARTQDPDSADSQFYITLAPQPRLDNQYTVFGLVVSGMDIVKRVQRGDKMISVTIE